MDRAPRVPPRRWRMLAHSWLQADHPVALQNRLEFADLVLVHGAFGQVDDVYAAGFLSSSGEHPLPEVKAEAVARAKLKEPVWLLSLPPHRPFDRAEVRRPDAQRPW